MFHNIPSPIADRMRRLEELDIADRIDGSSRKLRLRQVPPETGQFLALLAASAPAGNWIEIGTSAGYSTLWLSLAARAVGRRIITFEIDPSKAEMATETFRVAGVDDIVEMVFGDAREHLDKSHDVADVAFCFLDAEKEIYQQCYDIVVPRLVNGGLLVADNAISHRRVLQPMLDRALDDDRVDALIVPIGRGELVCRKL
ncbi:MAG: O-methyltransferase [bacterium]